MGSAESLELLKSADASDRLRGARALRRHATSGDRAEVEETLAREPDSWVQTALRRVLSKLDGVPAPPVTDAEELREISRETRAQATAEASATLLHELRPLVGMLRLRAEREIDDFEDSDTNRSIGRILAFLNAVERLRESASAPEWTEFNLSDLVAQTVESELEERDRSLVMVVGSDPVPVLGDENLVQLALAQALRNAVEATKAALAPGECPPTRRTPDEPGIGDGGDEANSQPSDGRPGVQPATPAAIVVNWGSTDRDYWVIVLDEGVGLPLGADQAFEMWATGKSKSEHFGIGLPLARRAIATLGGDVDLRPRENGGAACEIRWPHRLE